ncbi:hypothetical protein AEQ67_16050 [Pseudomonas sp. RIT-PI-q]|nr:hypothetical protein AEQ67_16050 [Pseudomonas sp. RIT-PI-q]
MPSHRIRPFAVEAQQTGQAAFGATVAIGGISDGLSLIVFLQCLQYRTLQIGGQQSGAHFITQSLLLREQ